MTATKRPDGPRVEFIELAAVRIDGGTQPRQKIDTDAVGEYAAALEADVELPPPDCVFDGSDYWLWDGFHRLHAHRKAGHTMLHVRVTDGTVDDARWLCLAANQTHGLRRTNADKRRAVELALGRKPESSDNAIASHCGVSHPFVGKVRAESTCNGYKSEGSGKPLNDSLSQPSQRTGKDGRTIDTANIGGKPRASKAASPAPSPRPEALGEPKPEVVVILPTPEPQPAPEPEPEGKQPPRPKKPPTLDGFGVPIQPHAAAAFDAVPKFKELIWHVKQARKLFGDIAKSEGGQFLTLPEVSAYRAKGTDDDGEPAGRYVSHDLESALGAFQNAMPTHTVCPWRFVDGPHPDPCPTCLGLNWTPALGSNVPDMAPARIKEKYGV